MLRRISLLSMIEAVAAEGLLPAAGLGTSAVTGVPGALAHPALVCDVAIGQSTLVTQRVRANLFYRGLAFHRFPVIGDSLFTRTEVVGLKQNSSGPTGLAALRMTTVDQVGRLVNDDERYPWVLRDGRPVG